MSRAMLSVCVRIKVYNTWKILPIDFVLHIFFSPLTYHVMTRTNPTRLWFLSRMFRGLGESRALTAYNLLRAKYKDVDRFNR